METLTNHFVYEKDIDNVSNVFENLSRQLKIIHSNNAVVSNLNSNTIFVGDELSFSNITSPANFEAQKRSNIISLAKMMIGTYLSLETGFKDFSSIDDEWFLNNFDSIFDTFNVENFDKDYFNSVFYEGKNDYYSDYLDRKRQTEALGGKNNIQGYKKTLRNAGSSLYEDLAEKQEITEKKANLQVSFNPILITTSLAIITILILLFALIK